MTPEVVLVPLRHLRRGLVGWAVGLGAMVALTVAFWPVFRDGSGISEAIGQLPPAVVDAFGLADFGTPAGFLRGNLYDVLVPLLMAIAAVAMANGLTASEEEAGRLETWLAQPVTRQAVLAGRIVALAAWVGALTVIVLLVQLASDAAVGLEVDPGRLVGAVVLCGLVALLAGMLAVAVAAWLPRPSLVLGLGVGSCVLAYLVSALFPLSDVLGPLAKLSPWDWALGGDPLVEGPDPWRFAALLVPSVVLAGVGIAGFVRRDIRSG
ncbi:MAG: ABC transporter permease subunit [Chloroflexota bacterium]